MTAKKSDDNEETRFSEAMDELQAILVRIEDEETDIDALAGKIRKAEIEVTQIVQSLEEADADPDGGEAE
jgi:exonuclease VII small subunit